MALVTDPSAWLLGGAVLPAAAAALGLLRRDRRAGKGTSATLLRQLEEQNAMLEEASLLGRLGSFWVEPETMTFHFRDELFVLWGVPPGSPLRADPEVFAREVLHGEDQPRVRAAFDDGLRNGGRHDVEFRIRRVDDGQERHVRSTVEVRLGPDGRPERITGAQVDVTDLVRARHAAQDAAALHRAVLAATPDVVFVTDVRAGAPTYVSPSMRQVLGYAPEVILADGSRGAPQRLHPDDLPLLREATARACALPDGGVTQVRYRCRHADGRWVWVQRRATPFQRDGTGAVTHVLGVLRDVSEIVEVEQRLSHGATHDPLTGLPNRTLLGERLRAALDGAQPAALVYLDLDGFKRVNDTAGHAAGDAVLREVARRLTGAVDPGDTVARLGGDEFVLLLVGRHPTAALVAAERVVGVVDAPIAAGGALHTVTASGGVVIADPAAAADGEVERLLADADTAMYRSKGLGKAQLTLFEDSLRDALLERLRVERVLRTALRDSGPVPAPRSTPRLAVVYQVVVDGAGTVVGVEALARLTDDHGRPVPPDAFVPVAEESDLVRALGRHVLDVSLGQLADWRRSGRAGAALTIAVNVSAHEVRDPAFADGVLLALRRHGLGPADLMLELTETVLLEAGDATLAALRRLHDLGVAIAIDDFGTGYASLRYLTSLPVDVVKVDRAFTAGLPHDRASATVLRAVVGLAEDLGLGCVVEGVETPEQRAALPPGVHLQGWLIGRPMPADRVELGHRLVAR